MGVVSFAPPLGPRLQFGRLGLRQESLRREGRTLEWHADAVIGRPGALQVWITPRGARAGPAGLAPAILRGARRVCSENKQDHSCQSGESRHYSSHTFGWWRSAQ
jgi:hypothetical protein